MSKSFSRKRKSSAASGWQEHLSNLTSSVRTSHVVAIGLVLVVLFVFINFLTGSRATAKDPAQFPETNQQEWEVEQAAAEARWALEQPADDGTSETKSDDTTD